MADLLCRSVGPVVDKDDARLARAAARRPHHANQIELALLNLAVNARDAMPNGGTLTFRTPAASSDDVQRRAPALKPGDYVCIQVMDTGVGMTEEIRSRAQEPFFTTKGPGGGTRLGLSMVDGFVSELGGALTFDSAVGVGTTVSLFLCRAEGIADDTIAIAESDVILGRPGRLLLIDDNDSVREAVRAMLEDLGHSVVEVTGGAEALELLANDRSFDLLIVDFAMPVMNGSELAGEVTKTQPDMPILFVTGYVENDALRPWTERGYRTLRKPFACWHAARRTPRRRRWIGRDVLRIPGRHRANWQDTTAGLIRPRWENAS